MSLEQDKKLIVNELKKLLHKDYVQQRKQICTALQALAADMNNSFYTIVVLGEFKRGKSTFVNALLGESVLPMNVLPETATINAVMYSETPELTVVYNDGRQERGEVSHEFLEQFSAQQETELARKVKYIKIGYPLDMLKNRVVLVDTPGVSDMDEQRCDVTYQFIPKANAVLFLLDANSPLKKTEKDFIEQRLLPLGIDNIIFLLNKYDGVDEDEEEDDLLEDVRERLNVAFAKSQYKLKNVEVYPLSAKDALQGIEQGKDALIELSGLNTIKDKLQDMVFNGDIEQEKIARYKKHLQMILSMLERELLNDKNMKSASAEDLQKFIAGIEEMLSQREGNKKNIATYVDSSKQNMFAIVDKSLKYFHGKLDEDILDKVKLYQGPDFKEFIEGSITKQIQKNLESWIGLYSPHIDTLIKQLENELAQGISIYFKQRIRIYTHSGTEIKVNKFIIGIEAEDISSVQIKAGAVAAVGGIGLLALIGGTVMPLVGFAALPYLRNHMMKKKLAEVKQQIEPEIKMQIVKAMMQLQAEIHKYIDDRCKMICTDTEYAYEQVLLNLKQKAAEQLDEKKLEGEQIQSDIVELDDALAEVKQLKEKLA